MIKTGKKALVCLTLAALAGLALAGCGGDSAKEAAKTKSEIQIAINAEPQTYDIGRSTATVGRQMMAGNVYELLMAFDENFKPQPLLAENFTVNPDYTEYVYHLRKGVLFHNGQEMKADDVVASMNRWIENVGQIRAQVGKARFEKVDDYTVKITMEQPLMTLNDLIAGLKPDPIILPKSVVEGADPKTGMIKEFIGTGPYMVEEIKANSYLKLKKFDQYKPYGDKGKASGWVGYKEAKTPTVVFNYVPDSSTRVAGMQSGEYDMAIQMPFDDYEQFAGKDQYQVFKENQGDIGITYNKKTGIASNKLFRQAVNAVLNREDIMKAAYTRSEFYKLTPSFITEDKNPWYTEEGKDVYNVADPEKAKKLLAEAGYNGEEFRLLVSNQYLEFYNAAVVVERELKDIGVNVKLDVVDWPTYLARAKEPSQYDAFITGFATWSVPNVIVYLSASWNGWSDDEKLQTMMNNVIHSRDPAAAKKDWAELQKYCWTDYMPESKLGNRYIYDVASNKVKDVIFFEGPHMWNLTVEE